LKKIEKIKQWIDNQGIKNSDFEGTAELSNGYINNMLKTKSEVSPKMLNKILKAYPELEAYIESIPNNTTGDSMRTQKAFGDTEDEGLIYVPVRAQAGYVQHMSDPIYIGQLKRWKIPDFPYKGDRFRIFQIEGDSMTSVNEETGQLSGLVDGMEIVAERVDKEDWVNTTQWYVHVIVFEDYLMIKRLYREQGNKSFVLISDNPMYQQKRVRIEDIRELWIMKRYLGWNVPPPRQYKIEI
jgi:phage repressor protein C with HTH and peptisase S24 domain